MYPIGDDDPRYDGEIEIRLFFAMHDPIRGFHKTDLEQPVKKLPQLLLPASQELDPQFLSQRPTLLRHRTLAIKVTS